MNDTVPVELMVTPEAAAELRDARCRADMGLAVSRLLRDRREVNLAELRKALAAIHDEVARSGLTEAEVDAELEAYNAERRS